MFHEPYVGLIDNNGNNQNEGKSSVWGEHTDQNRWFSFASVLNMFSRCEKQKIDLNLCITWDWQISWLLANPGVLSYPMLVKYPWINRLADRKSVV